MIMIENLINLRENPYFNEEKNEYLNLIAINKNLEQIKKIFTFINDDG